MIKIESKIIVFSYIAQTNQTEIQIDKLFEYINIVRNRLKDTEYYFDKINLDEVNRILSMYSSIAHFSNSKIIISDIESTHYKINKFILKDIDENIKNYLVKGEIFVLPIIYNDNLVLYKFNSSDKSLNTIKGDFCFDNKNGEYIINLEIAKKSINNIEDLILYIILNSKIQKETINLNEFIDFISYINGLMDKKYKSFESYFKIKNEVDSLHKRCKIMDEYHVCASKNTTILTSDSERMSKLLYKNK